jgi:hypothetical protein
VSEGKNVKGRGRLLLSPDTKPEDVSYPVAGRTVYRVADCKEYFEAWKSFLQLPDTYAIVGVYFDITLQEWMIILESDEIPLPEPNRMIPDIDATYERIVDGKARRVRLVDLKVVP